MVHSVIYNDKPIEEMSKSELISAMEAVCGQLEICKETAKYWEGMYKNSVMDLLTQNVPLQKGG